LNFGVTPKKRVGGKKPVKIRKGEKTRMTRWKRRKFLQFDSSRRTRPNEQTNLVTSSGQHSDMSAPN